MAMRDGRGPRGMGPMTGKGMGDCNKRRVNRRDYCINSGRGYGRRPGMGRGNLWIEEEIEEMLADTEEE